MKTLRTSLVALLMLGILGCKDAPPQVDKGVRRVNPPRGSTISYIPVPPRTVLLASEINKIPAHQISNACYAVYVDERPTYDYAHDIHLFLVADDGKVTTLFHGNGFPDFHLQREDGSLISGGEWRKY